MNLASWQKLKAGSIVKSVRTGTKRRVLEATGNGCITLVMIRGGRVRLWCGYRENVIGVSKTVYVPCDRHNFKVHRY